MFKPRVWHSKGKILCFDAVARRGWRLVDDPRQERSSLLNAVTCTSTKCTKSQLTRARPEQLDWLVAVIRATSMPSPLFSRDLEHGLFGPRRGDFKSIQQGGPRAQPHNARLHPRRPSAGCLDPAAGGWCQVVFLIQEVLPGPPL